MRNLTLIIVCVFLLLLHPSLDSLLIPALPITRTMKHSSLLLGVAQTATAALYSQVIQTSYGPVQGAVSHVNPQNYSVRV